jgi:hypothetical protein
LQGATCLDIAPETPPLMYRRFGLEQRSVELPKLLRAILGREAAAGEKLSPAEDREARNCHRRANATPRRQRAPALPA